MEMALIADIHGNRPALEAVAADIGRRGIEQICCLGDVVGKGPSTKWALNWARQNCALVLAGNWDLFIAENPEGKCQFHVDQLDAADLDWLRALPLEHRCLFSGRRVRLVHGRPSFELIGVSAQAERYDEVFGQGEPYDVLGYADIHQPGMRILPGDRYVFNTGSVGNALNDTRAHYVILSGEPGKASADFCINMVSVEYDREQAIRDARDAVGLVRADAFIREIETGVYSR